MLSPRYTPQARATLTAMDYPLLPLLQSVIDELLVTDGRTPATDPIPLGFPLREAIVQHPFEPAERWRMVFCTYPDLGLLKISVIERAPIF